MSVNMGGWDFGGASDPYGNTTIKPLFTVDLKDEEAVLKWAQNAFSAAYGASLSFIESCRKNLALYKGFHYQEQNYARTAEYRFNTSNVRNKIPKIIVNHLYDLTEQRVSRISRYKPGVSVSPSSTDYSDKVSAEIAKIWLDYQQYSNNLDMLYQAVARCAFVMGEAYVYTGWDPNKGDIHPDWKEEMRAARREGRNAKLPLLDEHGNQVENDGKPQFIDKAVRVGDLCYELVMAPELIPQPRRNWDDVEFVFRMKYVDVDVLRMQYPDKAAELKAGGNDSRRYDYEQMTELPLGNDCLVIECYHKSTEFLDSGRCIIFTENCLLSNKPFRFKQGELPFARFTDIDVPRHLRGCSFFINGKALNAAINDITSMIRRNQLLTSHPKWMVPQNSVVKKDTLGNDTTIVEFRGPQPPQLVAPPTSPPELFNFRNDLKSDLQQILGVFDVSRGNVPKRVDSALALQFLDEQENERANATITKFQYFMRQVYQHSLFVASKNYHESDKRLIRITGRDKEYLIENFDPSHLAKDYDVQVQNASALPQSKAARTQTIIELHKEFPDLVTNQQVVDMLEFGESDKFYDAATMAIRFAESEEESFLLKKPVAPPTPYEDLLVHHQTHLRRLAGYEYHKTDDEVKAKLKDHILATEYLMFQRARINPVFAQMIAQLPNFPVIYSPSVEDLQSIGRPAPVPDVAENVPPPPAQPIPPAQAPGQQPPPAQMPGLPEIQNLQANQTVDTAGNVIETSLPPPSEKPTQG